MAPSDGLVTEFYFQAGDLVDGGSRTVEPLRAVQNELSAIGKNCRSRSPRWFAK